MKKIIPISIFTLLLDILTKQIVIHTMLEEQSIPIIKNFFHLTYAKNTGVAFSFLEGKVPFIILMTLIIIIFILKYLKEQIPTRIETICYGLILGGALGNLLDRLLYGYVIDFFDFRIFSYHFPIFNIADSCIVVGIFLLLIKSLKEDKKNEPNKNKVKHNQEIKESRD